MTQDQEVDFSIVGADVRSKTDQRIDQIKHILREEGVDDDPELLKAFDEAVKYALKDE